MTDNGNDERDAPKGLPPKGEAETAWDDQGSIVERLRDPGSRGGGSAGEAPTSDVGRAESEVAAGGEPRLTDDVAETARLSREREQRAEVGRRLEGRAGATARQELTRATIGRMRGLAEIEDAQRIVFEEPPPAQTTPEREKRAARQVAGWFLLSAAATIAFLVVYVMTNTRHDLGLQNRVFGITLGVALIAIGAGAVVWVKKILPHEEAVQLREPLHPTPEQRRAVELDWAKGVEESGVSRRKVLLGSLGVSLGVLPLAPLFLLRDLGPSPTAGSGKSAFTYTAWRKGTRFVDYDTQLPVKLGDIQVGSLLTVVPEGHQDAAADSAVMLIRLRPDNIDTGAFDAYAARWHKGYKGSDFLNAGHVAYSKICTHAGCPVSLYQQQLEQFLCPCHQSTFEAYKAGHVIFGPAARALPMLPFYVDNQGFFRAMGDFPEPVGPSFWERG